MHSRSEAHALGVSMMFCAIAALGCIQTASFEKGKALLSGQTTSTTIQVWEVLRIDRDPGWCCRQNESGRSDDLPMIPVGGNHYPLAGLVPCKAQKLSRGHN